VSARPAWLCKSHRTLPRIIRLASDYVEHTFVPVNLPPGIAGFKLFVSALRSAFPDFQYTVDDVIAEGDKVVIRSTARGTQKAEFFGCPPLANRLHGVKFTSTISPIARLWNIG